MHVKNKQLIVVCPKCKKKFNYYESDYRPFCSEKCQQVDLGNWFLEKYAVPSAAPLSAEEQDELIKVLVQGGEFDEEI